MHRLAVMIAIPLAAAAAPVHAVIPLPAAPDWQSSPLGQYATGLGVADLDGDGWVDLVVANGNDMQRQAVAVYRNQGDGTYPSAPSWISSDIDYHGHLDLADVDGDGHLDCAVAVYLGVGGFGSPGKAKLYRGNGDATFSATPVWESQDRFYTFSVSFGDIDMDGAPDLACATGDDYSGLPERMRVYRNTGNALEPLPSWTSTEVSYALDVTWADFNGDGALDIAFAGSSSPNRIYFAQGGSVQTTAGWTSTDASLCANTLAAGDYNGDGWADLAVADNRQLCGTGRFKVYRNLGTGTLTTTPAWQSNPAGNGYGSHVSWIDIDEDGDLDLATGQWWGPVRIYENLAGALGAAPAYTSATGSVIENEVWEDVDNDGLQWGLTAAWTGDGTRRLFQFPTRPVRQILSLTVAGQPVAPSQILFDREDAWMILRTAPAAGAEVWARFVSSADLDLALTNWDPTIGQYLFRNRRNPTDAAESSSLASLQLRIGPNPSEGPVRILLEGSPSASGGVCEIFDVAGRRILRVPLGASAWEWNGSRDDERGAPPGVYWVRWSVPGRGEAIGKVIRR